MRFASFKQGEAIKDVPLFIEKFSSELQSVSDLLLAYQEYIKELEKYTPP